MIFRIINKLLISKFFDAIPCPTIGATHVPPYLKMSFSGTRTAISVINLAFQNFGKIHAKNVRQVKCQISFILNHAHFFLAFFSPVLAVIA